MVVELGHRTQRSLRRFRSGLLFLFIICFSHRNSPANLFANTIGSVHEEQFTDGRLWAVGTFSVPNGGLQDQKFCTGVLVASSNDSTSSDVVITAAHCVMTKEGGKWEVDPRGDLAFTTGGGPNGPVTELIPRRSIAVYTMRPDTEAEKDYAFVRLPTPLRSADFHPAVLAGMQSMQLQEIYNTTGPYYRAGDPLFGKVVTSRCHATYFGTSEEGGLLNDCSVTSGSSGSPMYSLASDHMKVYCLQEGATHHRDEVNTYVRHLANMCIDAKEIHDSLVEDYLASARYRD